MTPLEHSATPVPEDPEMAGEVRQLRSSEARILLDSFKLVTDQMTELSSDHLRLAGEVGRNTLAVQTAAAKYGQLETQVGNLSEMVSDLVTLVQKGSARIESMRPKVDSVPMVVGETIDRVFEHRELAGFREQQEVKKTLRIEAYKVALGVILAATLGILSKVGYDLLIWQVGHAHPTHEVAK
jgi:hypothetical protein